MYQNFKYQPIDLAELHLDPNNPRLVSQKPLKTQDEIVQFLFDHDDLLDFVNRIAAEGKNQGAERPYVVKATSGYTVVEGNTRIAAYRILGGLTKPPKGYESLIPSISKETKSALQTVDCTVAPSREALLRIMARSHFGVGDKNKWGYLGSRKAVYDEYQAGHTTSQLAKVFDKKKSEIIDLIIEYEVFLEATKLQWTKNEKATLTNPAVEFNPPIRFLQTSGHKDKVGISYDRTKLKVVFENSEARKKFKHLVKKLVISPEKHLGATASYDSVFKDYSSSSGAKASQGASAGSSAASSTSADSGSGTSGAKGKATKKNALFSYPVTHNSPLLEQLMKEAKKINSADLPGAATFLLRNIVESLLKELIDKAGVNPAKKQLGLSEAIDLALGNTQKLGLSQDDKNILKLFKKDHLNYLNLGSHGNVIPNKDQVLAARDTVNQFVKRYI